MQVPPPPQGGRSSGSRAPGRKPALSSISSPFYPTDTHWRMPVGLHWFKSSLPERVPWFGDAERRWLVSQLSSPVFPTEHMARMLVRDYIETCETSFDSRRLHNGAVV